MLTVPRLDDLDYQKLFERARARIPTLTGEWTDFNDHDPGITVLQLFAWLCDNLGYLVNSTGEEHRLKYLKLLGLEPYARAARCHLLVSEAGGQRFRLPRGTRMLAGDTVFELEESFDADPNRLIKLYGEENGRLLDLTGFLGIDDTDVKILSDHPEKTARALFGFEKELKGTPRLYLRIADSGRAPFSPDFSLVTPVWEYWDGEQWQRAGISADETCGLLTSGFLSLTLPGVTKPLNQKGIAPAHYLRVGLEDGCRYDSSPRVGLVSLSCATAAQTDTVARALELEYDGSGILPVDYAVSGDDRVSVAVAEGDDCWQEWFRDPPSPDDLCEVIREEDRCQIRFDHRRFKTAPEKGDKILVTIVRGGREKLLQLGETDGCANQSFELDTRELLELRLALVSHGADGRRRLTLYQPCGDLHRAGWDDHVFYCDHRENRIVFGDSIHGVQPEAGRQVEAVTLCLSRLEQGNVMAGQINRLEGEPRGITVYNPENARGGAEMRGSEELESELERKVDGVTRAVCAEDIRRIVLDTPGLLIDSVAVVPARQYQEAGGGQSRPNTIVVVVKPRSGFSRPVLTRRYREIILRHLEQYRLLTTYFRVESARYVGIGVFGRIALVEHTPQSKQAVTQELERLLDTAKTGRFGQVVDYGRLFSALEMLPAVRTVSRLSLEYTGQGGRKNEYGDIVLAPDSLAYLREIGIEFHG